MNNCPHQCPICGRPWQHLPLVECSLPAASPCDACFARSPHYEPPERETPAEKKPRPASSADDPTDPSSTDPRRMRGTAKSLPRSVRFA